jgi:YkoY family integral membrane protein
MGAIIFDMPVIEGKALLTLALVALLDSMLSIDNALVLAVVVEHLPVHQRARALRYGILGAYAMRGFSIFSIAYLVHFWPLKLAGSLYLLWLGGSHLIAREDGADNRTPRRTPGFWRTVIQVEWLDLTFSLDNLIATVALANGNVVITITGVFISILAMRFVASLFLRLVDRFPVLRQTAYVLVVFIGLKLLASVITGYELPEVETFVLIVFIVVGSILYERARKSWELRRIAREAQALADES